MAKNDGITLERLYIELGLDLSQLQSDILAADRTVSENISRLNREKNIIKLRMEADIAGLDRTVDAAKIFEIQQASLNQQLVISKDRMKILEAAYQQIAQNSNSTSMAVQNAEKAFLKEKIAVGQLEQAIKNLSSQKISLDTSKLQDAVSKLNSRIQHVRIQAEIDTSKLKDAGNVFDAQKARIAAVTRELELQRQKLIQLREAMYKSAQSSGRDSVQTLNIQSNVLQQIREINQLEIKLKELKSTNINLQIRADSIRQAEQTIQDNIARINARIENIKIKADIDVSKLGAAASEFDKAKAHVQGLNRELELQNQKLAEMRKAFATSVSTNGLNNVKTINLSTEIQKQIQEINQLEAKIKELNSITSPKTNNLLSGYLNFKGNVTGTLNELANVYSQLQGATASADSAIVASLGVIGTIPSPVGRAVAAFASLPVVLKGVENSLVDMTRAAAASGDAVYVMSRGFQMSFSDTAKFTTMCKTAGVDVNDLSTTIKRMQQQIVRGGVDSRGETWLKRYGESAFDASGRLKNLNDMVLTLSRALKRAQADGRGMEFILGTMRTASADAITAIEDAEAVYKQASSTISNGLANPALAHETQGNINQLNDQAAKMNATFSSALLPVTNEIVPRLTERMGKLTKIIADNKEVIRSFGRTATDTFLKIEEAAESAAKVVGSVAKAYYDWQKNPHQDEIVEKYKNDMSIETVDDLIKKEQPKAYDLIKSNPALYNQTLAIYQPIFDALSDVQAEVRRRQEELEKILKQPLSVADASTIGQERRAIDQNPESLEILRRARKYQEEADAVLYKMNHSEFENKKLDLFNWYNELVREAELSNEERLAIEKLFAAKSAQIEQERANKVKEINDKLKSLYQTGLENRLTQIEQEKQAWIDKCNAEVEATRWAEQAKVDAQRDAAMAVVKQQAEEFEAFQKGGYEGLQAYKYAKLAEQGVPLQYLNMTPEQLQQFQRANNAAERSLMPNFMTDADRAAHQQLLDESREFRRELARKYDEKNYVIVDGKKIGMYESLYGDNAPTQFKVGKAEFDIQNSRAIQKIEEYDKDGNITRSVNRQFDYDDQGHISGGRERQADYQYGSDDFGFDTRTRDYFPSDDNDLSQSFSDLQPAVQGAIESFGELPVVVQGISESLSDITLPTFEEFDNPLAGIEPEIASTIQQFTDMRLKVEEVTIKLGDLRASMENFSLPQKEITPEQKTPVNVSVTVQINEAHAWEHEHIQELAERVADEVKPAVINAIGGDSNSY